MSQLCPSVPFRGRSLRLLWVAFILSTIGGTAFAQVELPPPPGEQQLEGTAQEMSPPSPGNPPATLHFGASLAIDGRILLAGMPAYGPGSLNAPPDAAGRVAVFVLKRDNHWVRLTSIDPASRAPEDVDFGNRVALSERYALVGSDHAVFVFRQKGSAWKQIARLVPASGERYDGGLAVSGNSLMLGVSVEEAPARVDVFDVSPSGRVHRVQRLQAFVPDEGNLFGQALAASDRTLVVGAPGVEEGMGAAFVYRQVGPRWVLARRLTAADQEPSGLGPAGFGAAVAIGNGLIAVGAPGADRLEVPGECPFLTSGAAYLFARQGHQWVQTQKVGRPHSCSSQFASSLAISRDYLAIAAPSAFPFVFEGAHLYRRDGGSYNLRWEVFGSEVSLPPVVLEGSQFVAGFPFDRFFSTGFALAYDLAEAP
jgi:hypothetical protein